MAEKNKQKLLLDDSKERIGENDIRDLLKKDMTKKQREKTMSNYLP
jgi:hypothetical protein